MISKLAVWMAGVTLFVTAAPMGAHHSFAAEFDANRPVKLRGITELAAHWIRRAASFRNRATLQFFF